jgi:hypothetical protein
MKNIFLAILLVITSSLQAQRIRTFVGIAGYLDTDYNGSIFGSASTGLEFKIINNFRPEIELGVMYGTPETFTNYTETGLVQNVFERTTTAINYSFCTKIYLGNPDDSNIGIVILPKYTYSKVFGKTESTTRNTNDLSKPIIKKKSANTWDDSFGIGIGISVNFSEKYYHSADLILYFNGVNLGTALKTINSDSTLNTKDTLGLGVLVYFGSKKRS